MDQVEFWVTDRKVGAAPPRLSYAVFLLAFFALLVGFFGAPAARGAAKTRHLTGEVITDKKPKNGDPGSKDFSNIALRSGSQLVGKLALKGCNGLAINELTCSGKITLSGFGSGLEVVVRWPCEIVGESGKFTCASVGEGSISSKQGERGAIRIGTAEPNLFKPQMRFPVTIKAGG